MDFRALPNGPFTLQDIRMPGEGGDLQRAEVAVADGKIAAGKQGEAVDLAGRVVMPLFTDMHTHLDKGHIWNRNPNPDGTFVGALTSVGDDRAANWSAREGSTYGPTGSQMSRGLVEFVLVTSRRYCVVRV